MEIVDSREDADLEEEEKEEKGEKGEMEEKDDDERGEGEVDKKGG